MKPHRVSSHQKRLEAILDKYRDKEQRPAAERRHLQRLWREFVFPMRWMLLTSIILSLIMTLQPYIWTYINRFVIDKVLMVGKDVPQAVKDSHLHWVFTLFLITRILNTKQENKYEENHLRIFTSYYLCICGKCAANFRKCIEASGKKEHYFCQRG